MLKMLRKNKENATESINLSKKSGISMMKSVLLIGIVPLICTILCVLLIVSSTTKKNMENETKTALKIGATNIQEYCRNYFTQGNIQYDGETCMIGGHLISPTAPVFDSLKEHDIDLTLFAGDTRVATSIVDETGNRIVGTTASEEVIDAVLNKGQDYFSGGLMINGIEYYVYYTPLTNMNGDIVGMCFAGEPSDDVNAAYWSVIRDVVIVSVIFGLIFAGIIVFVGIKIKTPMHAISEDLLLMSTGDLKNESNVKTVMSETISIQEAKKNLQENMKKTIGTTIEASNNLSTDSTLLQQMSENCTNSIGELSKTIEELSAGAVSMAEDVENAASQVNHMGETLNDIANSIDNLAASSENMVKSNNEANETMVELLESGKNTYTSVDKIASQIEKTNDSVQGIREAISLIMDIATQTNLLSLNASIEAARAGEAGRGFAVVADEIKKLSEQSNNSAQKIQNIIQALVTESNVSVKVAEEIKHIVEQEQEKINETQEKFNTLNDEINSSMNKIEEIKGKTQDLEQVKFSIVSSVENLSAIAEENAASSEEVNASAEELKATFTELNDRAEGLGTLANKLDESVTVWKI